MGAEEPPPWRPALTEAALPFSSRPIDRGVYWSRAQKRKLCRWAELYVDWRRRVDESAKSELAVRQLDAELSVF